MAPSFAGWEDWVERFGRLLLFEPKRCCIAEIAGLESFEHDCPWDKALEDEKSDVALGVTRWLKDRP